MARDDIGFEFMLNALRLTDGVPAVAVRRAHRDFRCRSSHARSPKRRAAACSIADPAILQPTPLGRRFLNDLQALFLPDEPPRARSDRSLRTSS